MDPLGIGTEVAAIIAALAALIGGLVWVIRAVGAIEREMKPNGGSSIRDALNRLESGQMDIRSELRAVRTRVDDHVDWHLDNA